MLLWITIAALTAAVVAALVRPILIRSDGSNDDGAVEPASSPEIAVYKDQLAEVERDLARGLIGADEADAARREVARRLIAHAPQSPASTAGGRPAGEAVAGATAGPHAGRLQLGALAAAALLPLAAVITYIQIGSPGAPNLPHSARLSVPAERAPVVDLIGRVEARLQAYPQDGAGWDVIAPVYLRLNRFAEAANAFAQAGRLLGDTPDRLLGFAEATVMANNGTVTSEARAAFQKMRAIAPDRREAQFWLAHALEQDGDLTGAADAYRGLIAAAPADAPWVAGVRERLAAVTRQPGPAAAGEPGAMTPSPPGQSSPSRFSPSSTSPDQVDERGPTAADVAAVQAMPPDERMRMVEGMVDGLAERLRSNGRDLDGWLKLVRAYKVLGREPAAVTALADARKALADDAGALGTLDDLARSLGLGS